MVSAFDFRSGGRWFEPGHCRRVVSLDKKLYSSLSIFTHMHNWVPASIMLKGNNWYNWNNWCVPLVIFKEQTLVLM